MPPTFSSSVLPLATRLRWPGLLGAPALLAAVTTLVAGCSGDGATIDSNLGGDGGKTVDSSGGGVNGTGGASAGSGGTGGAEGGTGGAQNEDGTGGGDGTGGSSQHGRALGQLRLEERTDTTYFFGSFAKAEQKPSACQTVYEEGACEVSRTPAACAPSPLADAFDGGTLDLSYGKVDESLTANNGRYTAYPQALTPGQTVTVETSGAEASAFLLQVDAFGDAVAAPALPKLDEDGIDLTWDVKDGAQGEAELTMWAGGDGADFVRATCSVDVADEALAVPGKVVSEFKTAGYAATSFWWVTSASTQTTADAQPYGVELQVRLEAVRKNLTF